MSSPSTHVWLSTSTDPSFEEGSLEPQYKLSIGNPANDLIKKTHTPVNLITVISPTNAEKERAALTNFIVGHNDTPIFLSSSTAVREISLFKNPIKLETFSTGNNPVGNTNDVSLVLANVEDWNEDLSSPSVAVLHAPVLLTSKLILLIATDDAYLSGQIDALEKIAKSVEPNQKFGHLAIISRPSQVLQFTSLYGIFQSVKHYPLLGHNTLVFGSEGLPKQMRQDFYVLLKEYHTLGDQKLTGSFLAPFLNVFVANFNPQIQTKISLLALLEKTRKKIMNDIKWQYSKSITEFVKLKKSEIDPKPTADLREELGKREEETKKEMREKHLETITDQQFLDNEHKKAYDALCSSNLEKIAPWAKQKLDAAFENAKKVIQAAAPVSTPMSSQKLEGIASDILKKQKEQFLAMVNRLDQAKPVDKDVTGLENKVNELRNHYIKINRDLWDKWIKEKRSVNFETMTDSFAKLLERKPSSYNQDLDKIGSDAVWRFRSIMTAEYTEPDKERIIDEFNSEVARRVQLEKNKYSLDFWEVRSSEIIAQYCRHLNSSLKENVEPAPIDKITNPAQFLKAFEDSCKVSSKYQGEQMFIKLESLLRSEKAKWEPKYLQAVIKFRAWLQNELENLLNDCKQTIKNEITLKTIAEIVCLNCFDPSARNYKVDSPDSYGASLIKKYRQDLITFIQSEQNTGESDDNDFRLRNRELLISLVKHIYKKVGDSGYVSTLAFDMDVEAAKDRFVLEAIGDPTLSDEIWQRFNVQVPSMEASVQQSLQAIPFNGKTQSELEGDIAERKGFIEAIARVAKALGLSHTNKIPTFSHIAKNSAGERENHYIDDMWNPDHKTSIKLYDWQLKLDDAKCDDPFIEDMEPDNSTTIVLEHYGKRTTMSHKETTGGILHLGNAPEFGQSKVWKNFHEKNHGFNVVDAEQHFLKGLMPTIAVPIGKKVECSLIAFKQKETMTYTACATLVPKVYLYGRNLGAANEIGLKDTLGVCDSEARQPEFQAALKLLQDIQRYQFYIRGKFERINGQVFAVKWTVKAV
ncbi:hypothetical protein BC937DRAFT_88757 [Endogone sp. FLAS-F59071]|nr:hypothetical protein BC937DRAFT_88757 [Endogone sp. FLAS-F59071]|eukprot:RUS18459.1 hypothetical protein BC937DRAFT_88757 [Endogone sp. FLAS-F59071]